MSVTLHLLYMGEKDNARKFAEEMEKSGIANKIRNEKGNLSYKYFQPLYPEHEILLIDKWKNQQSLDEHHKSIMMTEIASLRDKYDLTMKVEMFKSIEMSEKNSKHIRK